MTREELEAKVQGLVEQLEAALRERDEWAFKCQALVEAIEAAQPRLEQLEAAHKALLGAERYGESIGLTEATYWFRDVRAALASSGHQDSSLEVMSEHRHIPVVRLLQRNPVIVCEKCGLLLDFRSLPSLGFYVGDWDVAEYEAPPASEPQDSERP